MGWKVQLKTAEKATHFTDVQIRKAKDHLPTAALPWVPFWEAVIADDPKAARKVYDAIAETFKPTDFGWRPKK